MIYFQERIFFHFKGRPLKFGDKTLIENLSSIFKELKGKINNNKILIDKQIFEKALLLNEEKKMISIICPKFAFYNKIKPVIIAKQLWEFIQNIFGGPRNKNACRKN